MSMPDDQPPLRNANEQMVYLLGGLNAKMDLVINAQDGYDTRLRTVEAVISGLPKKTPWPSVVAGVSSIAAIVLAAITIINLVVK